MLSATRSLLAENTADYDGSTHVNGSAMGESDDENPFHETLNSVDKVTSREGRQAESIIQSRPFSEELPLLRATRDMLEDKGQRVSSSDDVPDDILDLEREVEAAAFYPYMYCDRITFERSCEAKNWALARVVARRILRSAGNPAATKQPHEVGTLVAEVEATALSSLVEAGDLRMFRAAIASGDFGMAKIIGEQIITLNSSLSLCQQNLVDV